MAQKPKSIEECAEEKTDRIISRTENRRTMIFLNKNRKVVKVVKVDGCAITEGLRCDYLVLNEKEVEFFVELKGTDIRHAFDQLDVSIRKLSTNPSQKPKYSFIVSSNVAPAIDTKIQIQKRKFKEKFNCKLIVKNRQCEFNL